MQYSKEKRLSKKFKISLPKINVERVLTFTSIFMFLVVINTLFFSDRNIFVLKEKLEIKDSLENQVKQIEEENNKLSKQIEHLKTDNFYIEKKAREDLGLMREGEEVFVLSGYRPINKTDKSEKEEERWIDKVLAKYQQFKLKHE
ncbi:MAG: septum formation initiator family protein [Hydrogenothermaceae bacterium]